MHLPFPFHNRARHPHVSPDTTVAAGHILLQAGSLLNVAVTAAPGPAATAASPRSSPAPPPTPGSQAITPSVFAPQPYDPTAC